MIKVCPSCKMEYEPNNEDSKICFSCFKAKTNQRHIDLKEIVLDCDHKQFGEIGIVTLTNLFSEAGYRVEVYKAEGQKSPHAHIKDIPNIETLSKEQNKRYKTLLIKKYIDRANAIMPCPELDFIDLNLCIPNHLIAEENKPHWKYGTVKKLLVILNGELKNFSEPDIYNESLKEEKRVCKPNIHGSGITSKIIQAINIKDIAQQYGLDLHGNKCYCPFHADGKTPSLVFYEQQGRFHCFGCGADGNIIHFYAKLLDLKSDFVPDLKLNEVTA